MWLGGAGLQFRQGKKTKYIPYELSDKVIDWKSMWFYIRNLSSSLPLRTPGPLVKKSSWNSKEKIDMIYIATLEFQLGLFTGRPGVRKGREEDS